MLIRGNGNSMSGVVTGGGVSASAGGGVVVVNNGGGGWAPSGTATVSVTIDGDAPMDPSFVNIYAGDAPSSDTYVGSGYIYSSQPFAGNVCVAVVNGNSSACAVSVDEGDPVSIEKGAGDEWAFLIPAGGDNIGVVFAFTS